MINCAENGIRYGTIYLNHLNPDVADYLFTDGDNVSEKDVYEYCAASATAEAAKIEPEELEAMGYSDSDDYIQDRVEELMGGYYVDEPRIEGEYEGITYMIDWLGGAPLLWVIYSPYVVKCGLCSPCVPNAGDLESVGDYEAYGVPDDWLAEDF